jgi:hypothetical protein
MPETGTSGLMSGDGKRGAASAAAPALVLDSTIGYGLTKPLVFNASEPFMRPLLDRGPAQSVIAVPDRRPIARHDYLSRRKSVPLSSPETVAEHVRVPVLV